MVPKAVYTFLRTHAISQRDIRKVLVDPSQTANNRKQVLTTLNDVSLYFSGFFEGLEHAYGKEVTNYLREYYRQAGSAEGLRFSEEKESAH